MLFYISKQKNLKYRELIIKELNSYGLGTSIYYPKPVPLLDYYKKKLKLKKDNFKISNLISNSSINLPIGPHLSVKDIKKIVKIIIKVFDKYER